MSDGRTIKPEQDASHALPPWFDKMQMYLMLPLLLAAEGIINGNMLALGIGTDTPEQILETGVMYTAGFLMGGMALRCSATAAQAYQRREFAFTLLNSFGVLLFAVPEVWASLVVRSVNLPTTAPDNWLLSALAVQGSRVTPSNIIVSFALPLVTVFWGFATRKRTRLSAEELLEIEQHKTIKARAKAERRVIGYQSVGAALRGGLDAAKASGSTTDTPDLSMTEGAPTGSSKRGLRIVGRGDSGPLLAQKASGLPASKGPWKKEDVLAYVSLEYPVVTLSEAAALEAVKVAGNGRMKGTSYVANITAIKAWARQHYGLPKSELESVEVAG
jgi:hypothetical protein